MRSAGVIAAAVGRGACFNGSDAGTVAAGAGAAAAGSGAVEGLLHAAKSAPVTAKIHRAVRAFISFSGRKRADRGCEGAYEAEGGVVSGAVLPRW